MCIIKTVKKNNFAQINNKVFEGKKLSWPAKGLLGYLLSRPSNWYFTVRDLINQGCSGRDGVLSILKELEKQGYVVRKKNTDKKGRFKWEKIVYEDPSLNPAFKLSDTTSRVETGDKSPSNHNTQADENLAPSSESTQSQQKLEVDEKSPSSPDLQVATTQPDENLAPSSESTQSEQKFPAYEKSPSNHNTPVATTQPDENLAPSSESTQSQQKFPVDEKSPSNHNTQVATTQPDENLAPSNESTQEKADKSNIEPPLDESDLEMSRYFEEYDKMLEEFDKEQADEMSVEQTYTKEAEIEEPSTQPQVTTVPSCVSQNTQTGLSFSQRFSEQMKMVMIRMLFGIENAQELINALERKMEAGIVRDPIAYLGGIIKKYRNGNFTPVTNDPPSEKNADLVFTQDFTEESEMIMAEMLRAVDEPQKVLQTLEAQMEKGVVKNPIQYLGGLIKSCHDGTFTPVLTEKQKQQEVADKKAREEQAIKDCPFCDKYGFVKFHGVNETGINGTLVGVKKWSRNCEHREASIMRSVEELSERFQKPFVVGSAKPGFRGPAEKIEKPKPPKPARKPGEARARCMEALRKFNSNLADRFVNAGELSPA
jgi:hypothetical protein